jgi:hypothetical protein
VVRQEATQHPPAVQAVCVAVQPHDASQVPLPLQVFWQLSG